MVKAIFSTPVGRKVVATTMLATAVMGANATNLRTNNENVNINQTEVVSSEAASALKARAMKSSAEKVVRNKKLDKLLLDTCKRGKETKEVKSSMDAIYDNYGPNVAMIQLQRNLDDFYIEKAFQSYLDFYGLTNKDRDIADQMISHFYGWRDNVYYTELSRAEMKLYNASHKLSADECIEMIDSHVKNKEFFSDIDASLYEEFSKNFVSKQEDKLSPQAKLDLLSYKTHLLNSLAFNKYFEDNELPHSYAFVISLGYDFINGQGVIKP